MRSIKTLPNKSVVYRAIKKRKINKHVLIVTEGEKTEPLYFEELRRIEKLSTLKLKVASSEYGSNPLSVVNYAIHLKKENKKENKQNGEPKYDKIFCVIDRDDHCHFNDAICKANDNGLNIIKSVPCFEIWYLLHFEYSTKSYDNRLLLYKKLRSYLGKYEKSYCMYFKLNDKLSNALNNAALLRKQQKAIYDLNTDHPNPYTDVDELVNGLLTKFEE